MSGENDGRRRGRPPKKQSKTMEDIQNNDSINELQSLFEDLEGACKVTVTRLGPHSYATGHCGIFHIGSGKQISIDEVARRFGGGQYMLISRDSNGGHIKAKKQIEISGPPLFEGKRIYPNGEVEEDRHMQPEPKPEVDPDVDLLTRLVQAGASGDQIKAAIGSFRGYPAFAPPVPQPQPEKNTALDLASQQLTMQIMQQIMQMSTDMQRHTLEINKQMREYRDDANSSVKPADPLGDVKTMLAVMQELKSAQSIVGGDSQSAIATALPTVAQILSDGLGEYFAYKQASAAAQLSGMQATQAARPPLESRHVSNELPAKTNNIDDIIRSAREMGQKFKELDPVGKQMAMKAFLSADEQNVDDTDDNDIIDTIGETNFLGPEDRALLNDNDGDQGSNVSDSDDTAAAAFDYQTDSARH